MKEFNSNSFREEGHKLIDMLADYLDATGNGTGYPVLPVSDPDRLAEYFKLDGKKKPGISYSDITSQFLNHSNHLHHPGYIGHQCTSPLPLAALSHLTASLLNNGSAVYEMGPANTAMERAVLKHLAGRIGFSEKSDGVLTHGGSAGNLTGLLAARQAKSSYNIWEEGVKEDKIPGFIVSGQSHYSIARNLKIMGLGAASAIPIASDKNFRMDTSLLEKTLEEASTAGIEVVAVVANACSTATGTYDNLEEIGEFCRKHNLWLHVDGAHGLGVVFSDRYRGLVSGIENADSVVVDFHKMFMIPGLNTAVIFRDGDRSYETFAQNASYLFEKAHAQEWYNSARRTLECTKSSMGFIAWSAFRYYGDRLFGDYIDNRYDTAREFASIIESDPEFNLLTHPESNIICFRHIPEALKDERLNQHNSNLRKRVISNGSFYIVQAEINGDTWLRITIINPMTGIEKLKALLDEIKNLAGSPI